MQHICNDVGVHEYGFYGGKGTDVTACIKLTEAMKDEKFIDEDAIGIRPIASADCDPDCIHVLSCLIYKGQPVLQHVFGNIRARMKEEHKSHIENLELSPNAEKEARIDSHKEQYRYLKEAVLCKDLFRDGLDKCYQCEKSCPICEVKGRGGFESQGMLLPTESTQRPPSDDESQMPRDESQQLPLDDDDESQMLRAESQQFFASDDESQMPSAQSQQLPTTQKRPGPNAETEPPSKFRRTMSMSTQQLPPTQKRPGPNAEMGSPSKVRRTMSMSIQGK